VPLRISEIFGYGVENQTSAANESRGKKRCPFRDSPCTKTDKVNPLGICSLSDGSSAASLCPVRFLEGNRIFKDAGVIAFGEGATVAAFPEVRILRVPARSTDDKTKERIRKIGKVDFLLGKIEGGKVVDFAALEVQAAYFSGKKSRPALDHYLQYGALDPKISDRRPDFRSSAQKRLMPQLLLKVPVFRTWGKRVFVVTDTHFFGDLPLFATTSRANGEVTWLSYPLLKTGPDYVLSDPNVIYSKWQAVQDALQEGEPPEPDEIIAELESKLDDPATRVIKT
jgi:hypothetical protein